MSKPTFPEMYEKVLAGTLFRPFVGPLLESVALAPGDRALDVCCGTGIVAREAAQAVGGANVQGVDIDPEMLAVARTNNEQINWKQGDAQGLPFEAGAFDVVLCQQGLQFVPDKPTAVGEMKRVLATGGRIGIATWRPVEENAIFAELQEVAERRLGPIEDRRHSYGDIAAIEALLTHAGFAKLASTTISRTITIPEGRTFIGMNAMALVAMAGVTPESRVETAKKVVDDSEPIFEKYASGEAAVFEVSTNIVSAHMG